MKPIEQRFWAKVDKTEGCWNWTGARTKDGHGLFCLFRSRHYGIRLTILAHRLSYESVRGQIPDGLEIDHLCRNPSCVNPSHLEAVTHRTNVMRGTSITSRESRQTHCLRGHPLSADNLIQSDLAHGIRRCKVCNREKQRRWYRRKGMA